jgi:hypothetical protein
VLTPGRRFAKKAYAPIEIVQTEKKGFGLRAAAALAECVFRPSAAGVAR